MKLVVRRRLHDGGMEQRVYDLVPVSPEGTIYPAPSGDEAMLLADMEYQANSGTPQQRPAVRVWVQEDQ